MKQLVKIGRLLLFASLCSFFLLFAYSPGLAAHDPSPYFSSYPSQLTAVDFQLHFSVVIVNPTPDTFSLVVDFHVPDLNFSAQLSVLVDPSEDYLVSFDLSLPPFSSSSSSSSVTSFLNASLSLSFNNLLIDMVFFLIYFASSSTSSSSPSFPSLSSHAVAPSSSFFSFFFSLKSYGLLFTSISLSLLFPGLQWIRPPSQWVRPPSKRITEFLRALLKLF